jgi:putative hydrolase of the HAD superfamily
LKKYQHLFFDLDHTLWDYDTCVKESLLELYQTYELINYGIPLYEQFVKAFYEVNFKLWALYDVGKIDKAGLRAQRFQLIFQAAGASKLEIPLTFEDDFIHKTSSKPHVLPYAFEILEYLKPKYGLHIITNGFNESQSRKLNASGLTPYFDLVITSETTGHKKPDPKIFQYALDKIDAHHYEVVMIGDNPDSDILGAKNAEIDQIFFNPYGKEIAFEPTHTIQHLSELEKLL